MTVSPNQRTINIKGVLAVQNTYLEELLSVLRRDSRLVNKDNKLLKSKITEHARNLDEDLVSMLLASDKLKRLFFKEISSALVFDQEKFLTFVHNEAFLDDSYTAFKKKIGLATGKDDYIGERSEVVLNWPYKDCVLEGGQDKEDQKREEVFWNETLGADQRDTLLAPKALTGFKRYDKDGVYEVTELSDNDNLIIKGNNLLVLHSLQKRYAGKIKLIYIDPPYNTGNDSFGYNDRFNHSTWLTFMKNRIEAAKVLLSSSGVFTIHCDDNEHAYLKVLCDEIFGRQNFINSIAFKTINPNGVKTTHATKTILKVKEYILVYKMSEQVKIKPQYAEMSKFDEWYEYYLDGELDNLKSAKVWKLKDYCLEKSIKYDLHDPEFRDFMLKNSDKIFQTIGDKRAKEVQYADGGIYYYENDPTYFIFKRRLGITLSKKIKRAMGSLN